MIEQIEMTTDSKVESITGFKEPFAGEIWLGLAEILPLFPKLKALKYVRSCQSIKANLNWAEGSDHVGEAQHSTIFRITSSSVLRSCNLGLVQI